MIKAGFTGGLPKRGRFVVSIDRLLEDPANERKTFRNMEGLIESVRVHGIVEPITVTQEGEGYRILTGHRRFRAAKAAELKEIEVIVREPEEAHTRRLKSIISNIQREDIGVVDLAETLSSMLEEGTVTSQQELARLIGKSKSWVSDILRILTLSARLQQQLRAPEVSIGYDVAIRIARADNVPMQEELVEMAVRGESGREIRRRLDSDRASSPGKKPSRSKNEQVSETLDGYTAFVRGPKAPDANERMKAAIYALLSTLG